MEPETSAVLRNYLQTTLGATASTELVARLEAALAPDCLGPFVLTVDHVHTVRVMLEQMDAVRALAGVGGSDSTVVRTTLYVMVADVAASAELRARQQSAPGRGVRV
jgi:hypothetical protein